MAVSNQHFSALCSLPSVHIMARGCVYTLVSMLTGVSLHNEVPIIIFQPSDIYHANEGHGIMGEGILWCLDILRMDRH